MDESELVIIELKQWQTVERSEIDECVVTFLGGQQRSTTHPSVQASHYEEYLASTLGAFEQG